MIPGAPSAAVIAVEALASLCQTIPGLQVVDGPPAAVEPTDNMLFVGWSGDNSPSVLATRESPDFTGRAREEGDVVCVIDCYSGDDPPPFSALRSRAQTFLAALDAILRAQPGLGGAVDGAWLGEALELAQNAVEDGATVRVAFSVHYVAEL